MIYKLLEAAATPRVGGPVYNQRRGDETAVIQVSRTAGTFTLKVQGRVMGNLFIDLAVPGSASGTSITDADIPSGYSSVAFVVPQYPEMQVNLTAVSGGNVSAWLIT